MIDKTTSLESRVAALENLLSAFVGVIFAKEDRPIEGAIAVYQIAIDVAVMRHAAAQPGPEKAISARAMPSMHYWIEGMEDYLT